MDFLSKIKQFFPFGNKTNEENFEDTVLDRVSNPTISHSSPDVNSDIDIQKSTSEKLIYMDALSCTHCGNKRDKLDLYCYFRWDGGCCSDLRHFAPQVAVPSLVQYCDICGKYFWVECSHVQIMDTDDYNWIEPVDYPALKDGAKVYDEFDWNDTVEFNQRLRLLWAYNDYFYRSQHENLVPTEEDMQIHKANILCLVRFYKESPHIASELLREAGYFDESIKMIESRINTESVEREEKFFMEKTLELAYKKECRPFVLSM